MWKTVRQNNICCTYAGLNFSVPIPTVGKADAELFHIHARQNAHVGVRDVVMFATLWVGILTTNSVNRFHSGICHINQVPCPFFRSHLFVFLVYCCTTVALTETHTRTLLINGRVLLPQARGADAGRFIWYIVAAGSALLHWTLSNTCSPIRGCCVGVAWLCHCTDWHCPASPSSGEDEVWGFPRHTKQAGIWRVDHNNHK